MDPRIVPFPERAERIFATLDWRSRLTCFSGVTFRGRKCIHQVHVAIGAACKTLAVLRFALRAEHDPAKSTTPGIPSWTADRQDPLLPRFFPSFELYK